MLNVLLVDDHEIVREGLKRVLSLSLSEVSYFESGTGQGALDAMSKEEIQIAILDINLPDKDGLELLKEIKLLRPSVPVLILSLYEERQYALRALKGGAAGYLTKDMAGESLAAAVQKVLRGGIYISPSLAERMGRDLIGQGEALPHEALSDREYEVLRLLSEGKSLTEIAGMLSLSDKTISTYRARMLQKLKLKTNAALIRYALDHQLVE
ncbi:MAG: response regulator transcription factor [Nitrospirota bacterium]|nr:response regulator transcription factor [Nitrospirota bacterium]